MKISPGMQLNKFLALCGIASRRKADTLIREGRIRCNGQPAQCGQKVEAEDVITFDGRRVQMPHRFAYVLLHKPQAVITAVADPRGRKTVADLVGIPERVFPVGRLDYDTTGVLLLTNDGDLAYRLTHPKFEIEKVYRATVAGTVGPKAILSLQKGVRLEDGTRVSGEARIIRASGDWTEVEIRVHEGRKRQVRQMMGSVGHPVLRLERTVFAGITAKGLRPGEWRELSPSEIRALQAAAGINGKESGMMGEGRKAKSGEGARGRDAKRLIVAIDGPAGSGKSTTARLVAKALGWTYLDTGAMYRAMALKMVEKRIPAQDVQTVLAEAQRTRIDVTASESGMKVMLDGRDVTSRIRHPDIDRAVGPICEIAGVREVLVALQKSLGGRGNVVVEGRDMGTVVFPDAELKFFMVADPGERARRRQKDLERQGIAADQKEIRREIEERDRRDSTREHSPLKMAGDAVLLDTTRLSVEEQVQCIVDAVHQKQKKIR